MPSGFVRKSASPGLRAALRPDPVRVHGADDGEPVLRLVVADRVPAGEDRTGRADDLVRARQDLAQHLGRQLLRERGDREREQRHAAHREHVVERVRRGDRAEGARVVDDRREEVDREDERALVVEPVDGRVVGGIEPDEQIGGVGRHEAGEERLEPRRRVLGRAAAGLRERGQRRRLGHAASVRASEESRRGRTRAESHPPSLSPTAHEGRHPLAAFVPSVRGSARAIRSRHGWLVGIGLAIARMLAEEGYALTLAAASWSGSRPRARLGARDRAGRRVDRGGLRPARRRARRAPRRPGRPRQLGRGRDRRHDRRHRDEGLGSPAVASISAAPSSSHAQRFRTSARRRATSSTWRRSPARSRRPGSQPTAPRRRP